MINVKLVFKSWSVVTFVFGFEKIQLWLWSGAVAVGQRIIPRLVRCLTRRRRHSEPPKRLKVPTQRHSATSLNSWTYQLRRRVRDPSPNHVCFLCIQGWPQKTSRHGRNWTTAVWPFITMDRQECSKPRWLRAWPCWQRQPNRIHRNSRILAKCLFFSKMKSDCLLLIRDYHLLSA